MLVALVLAVVVRRWWSTAAVIGLAAGAAVAALHVAAIPTYPAGTAQVTAELIEMPRISQGQWGVSWQAAADVVAGAPKARVTLGGNGEPHFVMGDRLTATVRVEEPRRRGTAASLWIRGAPQIEPATGFAPELRHRMRDVAGDSDSGWLLSGMTLGLDQGLTQAAAADMKAAGLTHLTAVSGANCAVLLLLVNWLCGWIGLGRKARVVVGGFVLIAFVVVVGAQPSVIRAAVMAGVAMAAGLIGGRRAAAHVLQVAVVILLLIDPWLAYSVGFMLSVAATAGLVALLQRGPIAATVAAQVATLPILLAIGAQVGLRSIVANVLVAPLAGMIPIVGLASLVVPPLAGIGRWLCSLVLTVAGWETFGPLRWLPGGAGIGLAALVSLAALIFGGRHLILVAAVLVGAVSLTAVLADNWPPGDWWLVACDVGQGDGFVLRDEGHVIVVDAGPDPQRMGACLDRLHVRSVDLLVLTHFHADHVGGLPGVLSGRQVGQVWVSPYDEPAETYGEAALELHGLPVSVPQPGTQAQVGRMQLGVIWPQRVIQEGSVPNNASISFLLAAPEGSVAFLGDVEREAQRAILASADVDADIVKVPHHGSANFDPALPAAVSARLALVGVGADNTFGHPAPEAIAAWQASGAQVLTTEDNGDIAVRTDGSVVARGSR
ncbi:MAG: ComEC/Rec2 family competence protein [Candidatus Nanopelagicales bacterium]